MTNESRQLLNLYGSQLIDKLKFRDNFVMIGQKGLSTGNSIEKVNIMLCLIRAIARVWKEG